MKGGCGEREWKEGGEGGESVKGGCGEGGESVKGGCGGREWKEGGEGGESAEGGRYMKRQWYSYKPYSQISVNLN